MMSKVSRSLLVGLAAGIAAMAAMPVSAAPIVFSGTSGSRDATAAFDVSGTNLSVTLTNTSTADAMVPVDILTGVFFDINGAGTLTPVSATLGGGSTVLFGTTDPGGVVGGEWAYNSGIAGPGSASEGISSVGLGLFGPADRFPGTNLQGPDSPDGLQYGITSAGDNSATGNTPVTGTNALIQNQVVFTLSGLPGGFDLTNNILNVSFQYGTALNEPNVPGECTTNCGGGGPGPGTVPEPETLAIFASGLIALGVTARRRRKKA